MRYRTAAVRIGLSYYVTSGLSAAACLFLVSAAVHWWYGSYAAAVATIGAIVVIPPDQPAPRRGKYLQLLPAVLVGLPLFSLVRQLQGDVLLLGLLLAPATFLAFLGAAWGRRGIPISMSAMFAMIFAMAVPLRTQGGAPWVTAAYFGAGALGYLLLALAANSLLNACYRVQMLADALLSLAAIMRTQAAQFEVPAAPAKLVSDPLAIWLREGAALADRLQGARDVLLEAPRTARRQQLAGMLLGLLEIRDHLLACELDVDVVKDHPYLHPVLGSLEKILLEQAHEIERLADCLLLGRRPPPVRWSNDRLESLPWPLDAHDAPWLLARGLAARIAHIGREISEVVVLARGERAPDLDVVRTSWRMFISSASWSWQPFVGVWRWDAPPLRHAIRAGLAIGCAYGVSLGVPWGTHAYWILLTIVVVLRGSLSQTLERRNSRVAGTLLGSLFAGGILALHAPPFLLLVTVTLAQGIAHAFAVRRYLITAVAATVLALLQAHLLHADLSPTFEALERVADTLLGVGIAWLFSYVLPSWERSQLPLLVARTLEAQRRFARLSLALGRTTPDSGPELEWRLGRREAYDSLSALVQASQRALSEPRAVRPRLEELGRLLAHSYQLLAQLTAVKTMLVVRRDHLDTVRVTPALEHTLACFADSPGGGPVEERHDSAPAEPLPDPFGKDVTPWLLRRLDLALGLARQLKLDAHSLGLGAR